MFHVKHYGETGDKMSPVPAEDRTLLDFEKGLILGLLIGEGHFGGDGKQAHITLRMHARHEPLLRWIFTKITGSKIYGPYHHGGRHYFQWMCRGDSLKNKLIPLLLSTPHQSLDPHTFGRFMEMLGQYKTAADMKAPLVPPGPTEEKNQN
jgi:hypothetical protein